MPTIHEIPQGDIPRVAAFYRRCGYAGGISTSDTALAAMTGGRVVAAVRLCRECGVTVLRGMQVLPEFQRQGIGLKLLAACIPWLDRGTAYCLPYAHLAAFYGTVGFTTGHQVPVPHFLQDRQARYAESGLGTIVMSRMAPDRSSRCKRSAEAGVAPAHRQDQMR